MLENERIQAFLDSLEVIQADKYADDFFIHFAIIDQQENEGDLYNFVVNHLNEIENRISHEIHDIFKVSRDFELDPNLKIERIGNGYIYLTIRGIYKDSIETNYKFKNVKSVEQLLSKN